MLYENFKVVGSSLTEVVAASQKDLEPIRPILDVLRSSIAD